MVRQETFEDYEGFCEKFKPKKTTDDCYTPPPIYEAVLTWARAEYNIPATAPILRPFKPGGDYQAEEYPPDCVVLDNPPFSILSEIIRWYNAHGIKFFLFAPSLTLFNSGARVNYVVACAKITYHNGAIVNTSFITNLGDVFINVAPSLRDAIAAANTAAKANKPQLPQYEYPNAIISAARLNKIVTHGVAMKLYKNECAFIRKLDGQSKKEIFGGGFLLSSDGEKKHADAIKAAQDAKAAKAAAASSGGKLSADGAIVFDLSPREKEIQRMMDNGVQPQYD